MQLLSESIGSYATDRRQNERLIALERRGLLQGRWRVWALLNRMYVAYIFEEASSTPSIDKQYVKAYVVDGRRCDELN
jgi:hypothetical protein